MTNATDILPEADVQPLIAPARLTSTERLEFRRDVLELLEVAARQGETAVTVDLAQTVELDASGLGVLVLLQKRARERGLRTRLLHPTRTVAEMLHLTRLDALFEFVSVD
jgi:anti-anti-sigma factor